MYNGKYTQLDVAIEITEKGKKGKKRKSGRIRGTENWWERKN